VRFGAFALQRRGHYRARGGCRQTAMRGMGQLPSNAAFCRGPAEGYSRLSDQLHSLKLAQLGKETRTERLATLLCSAAGHPNALILCRKVDVAAPSVPRGQIRSAPPSEA
jgi:hypothetical protein